MRNRNLSYLVFSIILACNGLAQSVPSVEEKIPFICTFSKEADAEWGDDDFVQVFFFVIPESCKKPVYIRVFDPEIGGQHDESHAVFNSKTRFTIYGGTGTHSHPDARGPDPEGNYKSGVQMFTRTFGSNEKYDNSWVSLGPLNPAEGELQPEVGGRVIKIVVEGLDGDDGNLYKLFLSENPDGNLAVEGGNGFAYEYSFRLSDSPGSVAHVYPFVPENVTAVKIKVFDYDNEGMIRLVSIARQGDICALSEKNKWIDSRHKVIKAEINTSLDVQFIKQKQVKNNNVVVYITNQYNESMAFYTSPIGGIPKYRFKIGVKIKDE